MIRNYTETERVTIQLSTFPILYLLYSLYSVLLRVVDTANNYEQTNAGNPDSHVKTY